LPAFLGTIFFLYLCLVLSGCASQKDFNGVKTELDSLKVKNDNLEKQLKVLGTDKSQTLKNQAAIQSQFNELQTQIRELQGKIEELSATPKADVTKINELDLRVKTLEDILKGQVAGAAGKSQYEAAMDKYKEGKYLEALKAFDAYISKNPNGDLIDNANFWAGECLFAEGNYESAIDRYDVVLKDNPKSPKVPDCLYKEGLALIELGDSEAGNLSLKKVINEYPDSEAAKKARAKLGDKPASKKAPKKAAKKK
jgi:tol-pal system protein YbgF